MPYQSKWYVELGTVPVLSRLGTHGQHLLVNHARQIVMVKFPSETLRPDADAVRMNYRAMDAIQALLVRD